MQLLIKLTQAITFTNSSGTRLNPLYLATAQVNALFCSQISTSITDGQTPELPSRPPDDQRGASVVFLHVWRPF